MNVTCVKIGFSESPNHPNDGDKNPKIFPTLKDANSYLLHLDLLDRDTRLGYYKTDFSVCFDDGTSYDGRFDIGSDRDSIESHVIEFCKFATGKNGDNFVYRYTKAHNPHIVAYYERMLPVFEALLSAAYCN